MCYEAARDQSLRPAQPFEVNVYRDTNPRQAIPLTGDETIRPTFLLILRLFDTCLHRKVLTGRTAASDFDRLLAILHHPELPPLPADLTPEALAARRSDMPLGTGAQILDGPEVSCCTTGGKL